VAGTNMMRSGTRVHHPPSRRAAGAPLVRAAPSAPNRARQRASCGRAACLGTWRAPLATSSAIDPANRPPALQEAPPLPPTRQPQRRTPAPPLPSRALRSQAPALRLVPPPIRQRAQRIGSGWSLLIISSGPGGLEGRGPEEGGWRTPGGSSRSLTHCPRPPQRAPVYSM
jgi:hypothetical protein